MYATLKNCPHMLCAWNALVYMVLPGGSLQLTDVGMRKTGCSWFARPKALDLPLDLTVYVYRVSTETTAQSFR